MLRFPALRSGLSIGIAVGFTIAATTLHAQSCGTSGNSPGQGILTGTPIMPSTIGPGAGGLGTAGLGAAGLGGAGFGPAPLGTSGTGLGAGLGGRVTPLGGTVGLRGGGSGGGPLNSGSGIGSLVGTSIQPRATVSFVLVARAQLSAQSIMAARSAADREASIRRKAKTAQALWAAANEAEQQGDTPVAARIYHRLSLLRPKSQITAQARSCFSSIQADALARLDELDSRLERRVEEGDAPKALKPRVAKADIVDVFDELDALSLEYAGAPAIREAIDERISRLRSTPKYAAVLQEPGAGELLRLAQDLEAKRHLCCAFIVYEQAAELSPAPSGKKARERIDELKTDKELIAATNECRALQWCHANFDRAKAIKEVAPHTARDYFRRIVELSPSETPIHLAAREQLASLE
jgi:hypothetical protein